MTFIKKKKNDKIRGDMTSHPQFLTELAEKKLKVLCKKEAIKQGKEKIGKSYMINKLLEEL